MKGNDQLSLQKKRKWNEEHQLLVEKIFEMKQNEGFVSHETIEEVCRDAGLDYIDLKDVEPLVDLERFRTVLFDTE